MEQASVIFAAKTNVMSKWLFGIIVVLGILLGYFVARNKNLQKDWETAMANVKAYDKELSNAGKTNAAYQLTISQLKTYQDSILRELDATRKELKIKDSKLQSMHYVSSVFVRNDTITFRDTLFKSPDVAVDTLIGDKWYSVALSLRYPSMIAVRPSLKSEKHVIVSSKKETVNPPKKFFLFRWFQKKHYVLNIDVVEKNPYIYSEKSKYIEIIK